MQSNQRLRRYLNVSRELTWVERRDAKVISRLPLSPSRAGTRMKISDTSTYTGRCWNTHKQTAWEMSSNTCPARHLYVRFINPFKPNFTLSSSSTTSRELLSQFSTCSGWRWYDVLVNQFHENFRSKTLGCREINPFSGM